MAKEYGCKVCRVLDEHDINSYNEEILSMWLDDENQRRGYRELARWLNVSLLRREMDRVGMTTLGNEAESKYERLRDDDTRVEMTTMLENEGVDVDRLRSDFVSYGVVRTHLLECLEAEYEPGDTDDWESTAIEITLETAHEKIRDAVNSLVNKRRIETGDRISINLDVEIECETCHTRVPLQRALRRGNVCQCSRDVEAMPHD